MSRMTNESGRLPDRERFQPIVIKDGLLGKLGMGLFCSTIVAIVMNFAGLKWLVVHIFALFLSLFGKDAYVVKPAEAVKEAARDAMDHIKEKAKKSVAPGVPIPVAGINVKTKEEREADRIRKEESERNELRARADLLKLKYQEGWTLEKLRVEVQQADHEAREAARKAEEEEKKKPLLARADKIGLLVDKTVDYKVLKEQVEKGEKEYAADAKLQADIRQYEENLKVRDYLLKHGPNCRCPNPKCRYQFRSERKNGQFICPKCRGLFNITQAKANMPPPPMPVYPKRDDPNLLDRVKGLLKR
jgi:hypothetical protein